MTQDLLLSQYKPKPALVTKVTEIKQPKFPVIDAHNHLEVIGKYWLEHPVSELIDVLDQSNVEAIVDLDGGWGQDMFKRHWERFKEAAPERFILYTGVDWGKYQEMGDEFPDWASERLKDQIKAGAQGLKIDKRFGLEFRAPDGEYIKVDDPNLSLIWETAADLNIPITIHVADPVAFFDQVDETNERWDELHEHPEWRFTSPPYPPFNSIIERFAKLVKRHSRTKFIGAHVGCYVENLAWVSNLLDECPNFNVDISERIGELGRQPYSARKFFLKYPDRILFGVDCTPSVEWYRLYARLLETDDEYFNYYLTNPPRQGRWFVHGLYLPDDVLRQVYSLNAKRLINLN